MLDLNALSGAITAYGRVARVVIAESRGSTPRETGASMLIWTGGRAGTIGGGRLEYEAEKRALDMLQDGPDTALTRQPLGPALKQCCGGAVTLVTEVYDAARYRDMVDSFAFPGIFARSVETAEGPLPDPARRMIARWQDSDVPMPVSMTGGWLIEPVWRDRLPVYIYGAGHVGRALAHVLAPMPEMDVHLVDMREDQFDGIPDNVCQTFDAPPTEVMRTAPDNAVHFIMTPDHDYDLTLCHHLLQQPFAFAGLIGSETKWARFRRRLKQMGHDLADIEGIRCPIGDPSLGKHPQAIAVGVAAELLINKNKKSLSREKTA